MDMTSQEIIIAYLNVILQMGKCMEHDKVQIYNFENKSKANAGNCVVHLECKIFLEDRI